MGEIENFRRQHKEILQVATEISSLLKPDQIAKDAGVIRSLLSTLVGKLNVHLSMEDDALYPRLLAHKDANVNSIAKRFIDEMGGFNKVFREYTKKWPSPTAIQNAPVEFNKETKGIFDALFKRIEKEDNELFPLVNKLGIP